MIDDVRLHQGMIRQAVKDLAGDRLADYKSAVRYIKDDQFLIDCDCAMYPRELRDSLKEMVVRSRAERVFISKQIIEILDKTWGKKNPS